MAMPANSGVNGRELGDFIQAYEAACAAGKDIDLASFLPPVAHPLYAEVHRLLLALHQEYRAQHQDAAAHLSEQTVWNKGRISVQRTDLGSEPGHPPAPSEREPKTKQVQVRVQRPEDLGIRRDSGPRAFAGATALHETPRPSSRAAEQLVDALADMPKPGMELFGFRILAELGRGAFGCVYLAQQKDLASRYVALKISTDIIGESQALAQLQHTNIVPIYSVHRAVRYQAVCMPYFGATTVADLLKHWRERESLPASGRDLVSTLCSRKSNTRQMHGANSSRKGLVDSCPKAAAEATPDAVKVPVLQMGGVQDTAILEMLEGLSFVQAVLWIASRLADGLAHAHDRGILHRDLKPANVLLTDEGQPMLLDFSVAEDIKRRSPASIEQIGGTACYMAPEHLEAFNGADRTVDARSDLYSLGIILYEMLTRRDPFPVPRGSFQDVLPQMLEARKGPPPRLRDWNQAISPAAESIVRHCLEPDPAKRYQTAQELREDLERHRSDLPLKYAREPDVRERARKWMRRHPRLASMTSLVIMASILACAAVGSSLLHSHRLVQLEAQDTLNRFHEETKTAQFLLNARSMDRDQLDEGLALANHALGIYAVLDNPSWTKETSVTALSTANRTKLLAEMQDLLLLVSRATRLHATTDQNSSRKEQQLRSALHLNELAASLTPDEPTCQAILAQRAELLELLGRKEEAGTFRAEAKKTPLRTPRDFYLAGAEHVNDGQYGDALPLLQTAAEQDPQNFWTQLLLGICYDGLSRDADARACYTTSIALWPEFPWTYFNRGLVYLRQNDFRRAIADFDRVIDLRPDCAEVYMNRALAFQGRKDYDAAIKDLTHALELDAPYTRIYFMRARVRNLAGDKDGAEKDFAQGLRCKPTDEKSWVARGVAKLPGDLPGALADFKMAEELNARSLAALQNQAHVLSKLGRNEEAIDVLNRGIELYPDYVPARAGRGVLRARLKQRDAALEDANEALARDFGPATQYQVAGIFALTSRQDPDDQAQALHYLSSALREGYGFELLEQDKDLDPIRDTPEFRQLIDASKTLQSAQSKSRGQRPPP
jgi:serine/threonine protein kinase/Flp pilus assembly protein TadD